jgi:hypothetical protein
MKRIIVQGHAERGYIIELLILASGKECIAKRARCGDINVARNLASRWSTMNGGCPVEDRTAATG